MKSFNLRDGGLRLVKKWSKILNFKISISYSDSVSQNSYIDKDLSISDYNKWCFLSEFKAVFFSLAEKYLKFF